MNNEVILNCRWHEPAFQTRSKFVVDAGKTTLGPTALTNGKPVADLDVKAIDKFFGVLAPDNMLYPDLTNWEGRGSLTEHNYFSGEIAYRLATAVNERLGTDINPHAQKAALQLHDLGRTTDNSFMESDKLTDILWEKIGIREDLKAMTHNADLYWQDGELDFDSLSYSVRISILSDVFGKRSFHDPDRLRHKDEIIEAVKIGKQKYLDKQNRTRYEEELVQRLPSYSRKEEYAISKTLEWLESLGIDMDTVADEVMNEYIRKEKSL